MQAVASIRIVIQGLDDAAVVAHVMPVIRRLANGDWFTSRVSACGIFAVTTSRLSSEESKAELRTCVRVYCEGGHPALVPPGFELTLACPTVRSPRRLFATLCNDDTPMVRRAAAKNLGVRAAVVCVPGVVLSLDHLPAAVPPCARAHRTLLPSLMLSTSRQSCCACSISWQRMTKTPSACWSSRTALPSPRSCRVQTTTCTCCH